MTGLVDQLASSWPPEEWRDLTVLVAVSGGADSVALLRGLVEVRQAGMGRLVAAHFNHQLRGPESDADELFVQRLCQKIGVDCWIGHWDSNNSVASATGGSSEATARERRYDFLTATANRFGARFLVTAHTASDQAETILHRVLRGTGIKGLAGLPRTRHLTNGTSLIRPLLTVFRAEVLAYLTALNQPFREDSSNRDLEFTRNFVRHQLLPLAAKEINPRVASAIVRLGQLAAEQQEAIDEMTGPLLEASCTERGPQKLCLDQTAIRTASPWLVRQVLIRLWSEQGWPQQAMDREKWTELAELLMSDEPAAARTLPGQVHVRAADQIVTIWTA